MLSMNRGNTKRLYLDHALIWGTGSPAFQAQFCHFPVISLACLSLSFLICKIGYRKHLPQSVIVRIKWANISKVLRTVPGPVGMPPLLLDLKFLTLSLGVENSKASKQCYRGGIASIYIWILWFGNWLKWMEASTGDPRLCQSPDLQILPTFQGPAPKTFPFQSLP